MHVFRTGSSCRDKGGRVREIEKIQVHGHTGRWKQNGERRELREVKIDSYLKGSIKANTERERE